MQAQVVSATKSYKILNYYRRVKLRARLLEVCYRWIIAFGMSRGDNQGFGC